LFFNWALPWPGDKNDILKPLYFHKEEDKITVQAHTG